MASVAYVSVALGILRLPAKYYFDSNTIEAISQGKYPSYGDRSFQSIADFIRIIGLSDYPNLGKSLFLAIFVYGLSMVIAWKSPPVLNPVLTLFSASGLFAIGTVYFSMYTKEIIPFIMNLTLCVMAKRKLSKRLMMTSLFGIILTYAIVFRNYWFLTAIVFLVTNLISSLRKPFGWKMTFCILLLLTSSQMFQILNPRGIASMQRDLNSSRLGAEFASSAFVNYPSFMPEILEWPYRLVSLFFPFLLMTKVAWIYIFAWLIVMFSFILVRRSFSAKESGDVISPLLLNYVISHIITLSTFEPDYGSFMKHLCPFFPILIMLILRSVRVSNHLSIIVTRDIPHTAR